MSNKVDSAIVLDSNQSTECEKNEQNQTDSVQSESKSDKDQHEPDLASTQSPITPTSSPKNADKCILFYGVTYLGCASVNAPKSETEISRIMSTLNDQCKLSIEVTMYVPQHIEDKIILMDTASDTLITEYRMTHVLFVVRGQKNSPESSCFAFTTCQGDSPENFRFSCHVFRCQLADAVSKILYSFWTVFNRQQQKHQQQQDTQQTAVQTQKRNASESSSAGQLTSMASSIFGSLNFSAASFGSLTSKWQKTYY